MTTRSGWRTVGMFVSLVSVLASISAIGYVGFQLYGTNYVSRQAHEQTTKDLRRDWTSRQQPVQPQRRSATGESKPAPGDRSVMTLPQASQDVSFPDPDLGSVYALVRIPKFGKDYEVPMLEGVRDEELANGFGHLPRTAQVGDEGNFAIAAHRVTHGEPLRDMPKLRPGNRVIIETRRATYTYELDTNPNHLVVSFWEDWVLAANPSNPDADGTNPPTNSQRLLTLVTCSELFHTDNRSVAFGHLEKVEAKS